MTYGLIPRLGLGIKYSNTLNNKLLEQNVQFSLQLTRGTLSKQTELMHRSRNGRRARLQMLSASSTDLNARIVDFYFGQTEMSQ